MNIPAFIKRSKIWQNYVRFWGDELKIRLNRKAYESCISKVSDRLEQMVLIANKNGLGDRLKGMVFLFGYCKKMNIAFKISHTNPFDIRLFLEPNIHDWKVDEQDIYSSGMSYENINCKDISWHYEDWMCINKFIKESVVNSRVKQLCISSYQPIGYLNRDYKFSELFRELFRPTKLVQERVDYYKNISGEGGNYISVSSRFAGLIGDFNEDYNQQLSENERDLLLNNCITQIEILHQKHPDKKVLVCSDSITFLEMAKKLPYVFVIDGVPVHINFSTQNDIQTHLKTFVDFFMIAGAEKIFLLKSGKMYRSEFPITAAMVNDRPFEVIKF